MRVVNGVEIKRVTDVKRAHEKSGGSWFSQDTMRFWGTRVFNEVHGHRYFVTGDKDFEGNMAFSVRELMDDGSINTVSFQEHTTKSAAQLAAIALVGLNV